MNNDCLLCIFNYFTIKEIYSALFVCQQFNSITNAELLWKHLFNIKFNQITVHNNYKVKYKQFKKLDVFMEEFYGQNVNDVYNLPNLTLYDSTPSFIPSEIGLLTNLQHLELSGNYFQSVIPGIGLLTQLQKLGLHNNNLKSVPDEIGQLTQLRILNLGNNRLEFLSSKIGQLTKLEYFYLYDNKLQFLPLEIGKLTKLQELNLSGNQLQFLPIEIKQLKGCTIRHDILRKNKNTIL